MAKKKRNKQSQRPERQISIRSIRRDPPDYQKLGRAFLAVAMMQAEAEAKAEAEHKKQAPKKHGASEASEAKDAHEDPAS